MATGFKQDLGTLLHDLMANVGQDQLKADLTAVIHDVAPDATFNFSGGTIVTGPAPALAFLDTSHQVVGHS